MNIKTIGSICSGIEEASVAWEPLGLEFKWLSEIADFPSKLLNIKYPNIINLGDMNDIPMKIKSGEIDAPDFICGGTPCQAFSLAGWRNGLNDDRGNLTLKFVDILNSSDSIRLNQGKNRSIMFWENVEGVLADKTNAFGCFISSIAGLDNVLERKKWPNSGLLRGPLRNVAWRVLDAKYFGVPQQRKRLYVLAGDKNFNPENVLFELHLKEKLAEFPKFDLSFKKDGYQFEVFREYTDCLYSAYGTKWNGNAAAYNGSLFVVQNNKIRRLSPLECERLMGFPDNYTDLKGATRTNRYQAVGNSWAVPVIQWIGKRLINQKAEFQINSDSLVLFTRIQECENGSIFFDFGRDLVDIGEGIVINCTAIPEECTFNSLQSIIDTNPPKEIYISPVGCAGILRRKNERNLKINERLENILINISSQMSDDEIEKKSRIQKRGRFDNIETSNKIDQIKNVLQESDKKEQDFTALSNKPIIIQENQNIVNILSDIENQLLKTQSELDKLNELFNKLMNESKKIK